MNAPRREIPIYCRAKIGIKGSMGIWSQLKDVDMERDQE